MFSQLQTIIFKNFIPTRVGAFGRGSEWPDGGRNAPDAIPSIPNGIPVVPDGIPSTPGAIPVVPDGGRNVPGGIPSTPDGIPSAPNGKSGARRGVEMKKPCIFEVQGFCSFIPYLNLKSKFAFSFVV